MNSKLSMKNVSDDLQSLEWYFKKGPVLLILLKNLYKGQTKCDLNQYCDIHGKEDFDNLKKCYYLFSPDTNFITDEQMISDVVNTDSSSTFDNFDKVLETMKINLIKKFVNVLDNKLVVKDVKEKVVKVVKDEIFDMPKPVKVVKPKKEIMLNDVYKKITTKKKLV